MTQQKNPIQWARESIDRGNLPFAEIIARESLAMAPGHPELLGLLAEVARRVGETQWAEAYEAQAGAGPGAGPTPPAPWTPADTPDPTERYLLIRAWGYGFWSDVDCVLGQLLVAELAGRTPVVHWGPSSLFCHPDHPNAWEAYFRPVSEADAAEVAASVRPLYPAKWNDADPLGPDHNKMHGPDSRMAALYFLNREEPLAVADFHTGLVSILPWVRPGHRFAGLGLDEVYKTLIAESLHLQPTVERHIDETAERLLPAGPVVGIHLRGGDKYIEDPELAATLGQAYGALDAMLASRPDASVFAITDDANILAALRERLGDRLHTTDVVRTSDRKGIHTRGTHDGDRLALEVITDTYLATRCDAFVGIGTSNVSCMIQHLKQWGPGECVLVGKHLHERRNWGIHLR